MTRPSFTILITTYARPDMYERLIRQIRMQTVGMDIQVFVMEDDAKRNGYSKTIPGFLSAMHLPDHVGRVNYPGMVNHLLKKAQKRNADYTLFIQDDCEILLSIRDIPELHNAPVLNLLHDRRARTSQWGYKMWTDCNFSATREALDAIGWQLNAKKDPRHHSTGVGRALTHQFNEAGAQIQIVPFLGHGNHESLLHPEERKRNPLTNEKK